MKKFINKKYFALSILLSCLSGLELPFGTWSYSEIFSLITEKNIPNTISMVAVITIAQILLVIIKYLNTRILNRNIACFNQNVREFLMKSNFIEISENNVSKQISFLSNDLNLIEENYLKQLFQLISMIVTIVGTSIVAVGNSFLLTLVFISFAIFSSIIPKFFSKKTAQQSNNWSTSTGTYITFMSDFLKNIRTVLNYNALDTFIKKGQKIITQSTENKRLRDNTIAKSNFWVNIFVYSFDFLPIGIGIIMVIKGMLTLASFVAVQYSSTWIINSFYSINSCRNQMSSAKPMIDKLLSFKPEEFDKNIPNSNLNTLTLNNISFGYKPGELVLDKINLKIKRGDKLLLTGKSGQGKSTLLNLLTGQLKPTKGNVLVNGMTNQSYTFSEVQQTSQIFNDTLLFNLTLGKKFDDSKITEAIKKAGLLPYVNRYGLNTIIEENGNNLSGGEKKRIELARAFLYERDFLIVDEGTASLDPTTANQIHEVFLDSPLTVIEIDHHIPPKIMQMFNHHYDLHNKRLERIF